MARCILISLLLILTGISATAQRTTRRNLTPRENIVAACDTIFSDPLDLVISGYDKPLTSRHETFVVPNNSSVHITSITVEFNYTDLNGRQLHSRTAKIDCDIPPRQTRQLKTGSWDTQFNFYYHMSQQPRRRSTPYKATHRIISTSYKQ